MIDEIEPRCPNCDYDLRGLPIPHRCPECGTYVHVVQTVWKPTIGTLISLQTLWFIAKMLLAGIFLVAIKEEYRVVGILGMLAAAGVLGVVLAILLIEYRVTFGAGGIVIRRPFSVQVLNWDRVSHLQRSGLGPLRWSIHLVNPSVAFLLPPVLEDQTDVKHFHRSLALAKVRWARKFEETSPPKAKMANRGVERWGDQSGVLRDPRRSGPCPWCNYELTGHPAKSVCPSCGKEYSPALRVWKATRKLETAGTFITVTPIAAWGIYILALFFQGRPLGMGHKLGFGVIFAISFFIASLLESWANREGVVIVDERGVEVRRYGQTARIEWEHILSVQREEKNIVLNTPAGPRRIDKFYASAGDAEVFVRHATQVKSTVVVPRNRGFSPEREGLE